MRSPKEYSLGELETMLRLGVHAPSLDYALSDLYLYVLRSQREAREFQAQKTIEEIKQRKQPEPRKMVNHLQLTAAQMKRLESEFATCALVSE